MFVYIIGMLLQLVNVLLIVNSLDSGIFLQVYDIVFWFHLGCLYWVMWHFAMMFYFPCKLYFKVQNSHVFFMSQALFISPVTSINERAELEGDSAAPRNQ